jgi:hypothetical protein
MIRLAVSVSSMASRDLEPAQTIQTSRLSENPALRFFDTVSTNLSVTARAFNRQPVNIRVSGPVKEETFPRATVPFVVTMSSVRLHTVEGVNSEGEFPRSNQSTRSTCDVSRRRVLGERSKFEPTFLSALLAADDHIQAL